MEQIGVSHHLVILCFVCLAFSVVMCSEVSDPLIKTYVSSSLPSTYNFVDSDMLKGVEWITESEWDSRVIQSKLPVFVAFITTTFQVPSCQKVVSQLRYLDREYGDRIKFYLVGIDAYKPSELAKRLHVSFIPTTLVYKDGERRDTVKGVSFNRLIADAKLYA